MSLEERIFQARRADCRAALIGGGQYTELAKRWCDAWEREAALHGRQRSGKFWEDGRRWIGDQMASWRSPEAALAGR
jgi:hypothetical protein